jgi:serine/threonine protein kinase
VLLDSGFHCQITDFGSTRHCDVTVTRSTTTLSFNFAAPELIGMCATCGELDCDESHNDEDEQHKIKTMETDVYAFGCLYYAVCRVIWFNSTLNDVLAQIFFDTVPFHGKRDFQIIRLVTKGVRPERLENPIMEEHLWNLVQRCWTSTASERPTMEEIMATLILAA